MTSGGVRPAGGGDARRKRMSADERRQSILDAAARVFERTGDIGATTTKMIALEAGVNEAILYRHFSSKEEMLHGALVEPIRIPIREFVARAGGRLMTLSQPERVAFFGEILHEMVDRLSRELPAVGFVLFGDPSTAHDFYGTAWDPALRRLAEDWEAIFREVGLKEYNDPYLSAQIVVGTCLALAVAKRHAGEQGEAAVAVERAKCAAVARMMYDGVFRFVEDRQPPVRG